jgi:hypothetical protein
MFKFLYFMFIRTSIHGKPFPKIHRREDSSYNKVVITSANAALECRRYIWFFAGGYRPEDLGLGKERRTTSEEERWV